MEGCAWRAWLQGEGFNEIVGDELMDGTDGLKAQKGLEGGLSRQELIEWN